MTDINQLLQVTIDRKASDLHILDGYYPAIRIHNELYAIKISELVTKELASQLLLSILNDEQKGNLLANKEIDFGYSALGYRFRVNMYYTKNSLAASFRLIPASIKTIDELGLPPISHEFCNYKQGLVLITGPTGEGKSTSLASIINKINLSSAKHIVTIEDPIEFIYPSGNSIISQRELQQDTHSFNIALKSVLREDPDIILIGEMRDYDTIQAALTIAETGHLVFSTLHTSTASETVNRVIDVFPPAQQNQIRAQLSSSLKAVVSQRLIPNLARNGRVLAAEVLINTPAVASVIRDGKAFLIDNIIETGEEYKMMLFEKSLAKLYTSGQISKETAYAYAFRQNEIKKFVT
ncbi:MAG: PilT/PilU family type 4a pilus ATPase [Candidatus Roizmanbacteria bacterium]|nr:MAG: PilT/PilU family type 4a pilus ATPase [Candidatus Roizmanbacteria bacterium]